jgi:hypothetical protein
MQSALGQHARNPADEAMDRVAPKRMHGVALSGLHRMWV